MVALAARLALLAWRPRSLPLHRYGRRRGVVTGEGYGFGAVAAEDGFIVAVDDGEGVEVVQRLQGFTVACSALRKR